MRAPIHLSLVFTRKWKTRGMNLVELAILSLPSSHYKWARSETAFNKLFLTPSKGNMRFIKFNVTQRKFLMLCFSEISITCIGIEGASTTWPGLNSVT